MSECKCVAMSRYPFRFFWWILNGFEWLGRLRSFRIATAVLASASAILSIVFVSREIGYADEAWLLLLARDRVPEQGGAWHMLFPFLGSSLVGWRLLHIVSVLVAPVLLGFALRILFKNQQGERDSTLLSPASFIILAAAIALARTPPPYHCASYRTINAVCWFLSLLAAVSAVRRHPGIVANLLAFLSGAFVFFLVPVMPVNFPPCSALLFLVVFFCARNPLAFSAFWSAGFVFGAVLFFGTLQPLPQYLDMVSRMAHAVSDGTSDHGIRMILRKCPQAGVFLFCKALLPAVVLTAAFVRECRESQCIKILGLLSCLGILFSTTLFPIVLSRGSEASRLADILFMAAFFLATMFWKRKRHPIRTIGFCSTILFVTGLLGLGMFVRHWAIASGNCDPQCLSIWKDSLLFDKNLGVVNAGNIRHFSALPRTLFYASSFIGHVSMVWILPSSVLAWILSKNDCAGRAWILSLAATTAFTGLVLPWIGVSVAFGRLAVSGPELIWIVALVPAVSFVARSGYRESWAALALTALGPCSLWIGSAVDLRVRASSYALFFATAMILAVCRDNRFGRCLRGAMLTLVALSFFQTAPSMFHSWELIGDSYFSKKEIDAPSGLRVDSVFHDNLARLRNLGLAHATIQPLSPFLWRFVFALGGTPLDRSFAPSPELLLPALRETKKKAFFILSVEPTENMIELLARENPQFQFTPVSTFNDRWFDRESNPWNGVPTRHTVYEVRRRHCETSSQQLQTP